LGLPSQTLRTHSNQKSANIVVLFLFLCQTVIDLFLSFTQYMFARLPLRFLNWAYVRQGVYFGAYDRVWYARGIDFRRFSYVAKPSDFRRNFYIDSIEWLTNSDG